MDQRHYALQCVAPGLRAGGEEVGMAKKNKQGGSSGSQQTGKKKRKEKEKKA